MTDGVSEAAVTPMIDHVARFWRLLETEHVRLLVDAKRGLGDFEYFDSSSFPDNVAKAILEQRSDLLDERSNWRNIVMDLHKALGVEWGDNVYLAIDELKSRASQRRDAIEACARIADEADRKDEIDNGTSRTGAAEIAARAIRASADLPQEEGGHELVVFAALWAVQYQRDHALNGLHPTHYDLLKKYGARLTDFARATNASSPGVSQ